MSAARRRWYVSLAMLATLAGAVRGVHLFEVRDSPRWKVFIGDAARYHTWATEIAGGDWLGNGTFYQAPLYPYSLAVLYCCTGPDAVVARGMQAVLGVLACVLLAAAGARFFGPTAGLCAGGLLALWPAEIFHESLVEKAVLGTVLMSALLLALGITLRTPARWFPWLAAGAALGCLGLVRENSLLLAPVLLGWIAWFPRRALRSNRRAQATAAILLLTGLALPLAPVLLRNRVVGGEWRVTTAQFGPNFYIGNAPGVDGTYLALVPEHGTPAHEQRDATRIASESAGRPLSPAEVDAWWTNRTLAVIRAAPLSWLTLLLQKTALTWTTLEIADSEDQYTAAAESRVLDLLTRCLPFGLLAALGAFGLGLLGTNIRRVWVLPALLVTYTASVAMFYVFARYRLPLVPILALLAGAGLSRAASVFIRRCPFASRPDQSRGRPVAVGRWAAACGLALMAGVITSPRIMGVCFTNWPDLLIGHMRSVTEFNLAMRLWDIDAPFPEIEAHLARATRLHPDFASAWLYWGHVLVDQGQRGPAVEKFHRAVECDPDGADIRLELGANLLWIGRVADALPHLQRAVDLSPEDPEALHLLGRALHLQGRLKEALQPLRLAVELDPALIAPRRLLAITLDRLGRSEAAAAELRILRDRLPPGSVEVNWIDRRLRGPASPLRKPRAETVPPG
jgi:Flp pilus assembly protein TadD/4-amino-4-deoxy-L-arabinose transferase-like glycosyltransferase